MIVTLVGPLINPHVKKNSDQIEKKKPKILSNFEF